MRISGNPQKAYQQGYEHRRSDDTRLGMEFTRSLILMSMYNANETLPDEELKEYYLKVEHELDKQLAGFIGGEKGLKTEDCVDLLVAHDKEIRKRLNMEG